MIYRRATLEDIPQIIECVTRMVQGTEFEPPIPEKMAKVIQNWYTEGVWDGEKLVGFMVGQVCETFLNTQLNAYEKGLFVLPEHRGGTMAVRLLRNFEAWAKTQCAQKVWLGQSVGQNKEATLKFFERQGYVCQGCYTGKTL